MLMCRTSLVLIASLMTSLTSHSQVALQPWVQVYGTVGGYKLGYELWGVKPNLNLPYKAAIWSGGYISFYRLQSPTDTAARFTFPGYRMRMGDLNGDSLQDVVVYIGVNGYDTVFIFWGATTNIDLSNPLKIPAENHNDALRPACIGDINND